MPLKQNILKKLSILTVFAIGITSVTLYNQKSFSASLTDVSATLSNSRPSFRGALTSNNLTGTSVININTTPGAYYSTSSAQLVEGDTLRIGETISLGSYVVGSTPSVGQITITTALASGDADSGDDVISSQSGTLTVRFTTANAINDGRFRVLVPALSSDAASSDGIPDGSYFDFGATGGTLSTVTCPADVLSQYDFVAGTASASAITVAGVDYHSYECAYSNVGAVGTPFDGTTQGAIVINDLINPAPAAGHTGGNADRYNVIVQHLDNSFSTSDSTTVNIGVIEAVKITATVAPQISFRIDGMAASESICGFSTDVTTTPTLVPFGDLLIGSFVEAAQTLVVSTNAANGYAVTATANDQLGRDGGACSGDPTTNTDCIPDSRGDGATMTHLLSDDWTNTTSKGFAYTLANANSVAGVVTGTDTDPFNFATATAPCDGAGSNDCYRQFSDTAASEPVVRVMANTTPADNDNIQVCYKAIISATQAAGSYESYVTYTATATF